MRNLKRVLSLALALVMVLGMMVITTSAADYTDAEEITYKEAVEVMSALKILNGNPDGSFNPKGTLKRQEAAKIIAYVAMGTEIEEYLAPSTPYFTDIEGNWAAKYINVLVNLKVVDGNGDGTFNPTGKLTVAQFAKMLLLAAGVEGEFTGAEWKTNVKAAFNAQPALVATGLKITDADPEITREEACHMALAAMKVGTEVVKYYVFDDADDDDEIDENEEIYSVYDNARDAAMDKQLLGGKTEYLKDTDTENLLTEIHEVTITDPAYDKFGRPGIEYSWGEGDDAVELFYADTALKTFEGPVTEAEIFAAAGVKDKDATYVTYTLVEDGSDKFEGATFNACKAEEVIKDGETVVNNAKWTAAGTGYGIKSELYLDGTEYVLVSVREYLGTVKKVNPADEKDPTSKRSIDVELTVVPSGNETTKVINLKTEDFAEKDVVVVTVAGGKIDTIEAAKTVKGAVTKIANGVATIGGVEYVNSQNATGVALPMDGKEYEWYVDSFGNLLKSVSAPEDPEPVYYYGVLKAADGKVYVEPTDATTLLGKDGEGQEAAEVVQILTAEGKTEIFNTAWEYVTDDDGVITGVKFVNAAEQTEPAAASAKDSYSATISAADTLVKYELDENGKIKSIVAAVANEDATVVAQAGKLTTGKAQIAKNAGGTYNAVLTDETVFFLKVDDNNANTTDKYVAYTGYKNVPTITFSSLTGVTDKGEFTYVMIAGVAVEPEAQAPEVNYIYFADTDAYTEWNAEANEGKGAPVYVYENVYLNGEKTTVTFAAALEDAKAGEMYAYTVNNKGAMVIDFTDLLTGEATVSLVKGDYFKAGTKVYYVDDTTVYYQVAANGALTVVEGIPAVKDYTTTILWAADADEKTDITPVVYFSAVEIEE